MQNLKCLLLGVFIYLFSIPVFAQDWPTILTVYGNIDHTNRSASDSFFNSFLIHHDRTFDKAHVFNFNTLAALSQNKSRQILKAGQTLTRLRDSPLRIFLRRQVLVPKVSQLQPLTDTVSNSQPKSCRNTIEFWRSMPMENRFRSVGADRFGWLMIRAVK